MWWYQSTWYTLFLERYEESWMGTNVGSDSSKFGVLSSKPFNDVHMHFILFYFHKMWAGRPNTKYLQSAVKWFITSFTYLFCNKYARIALNRNFLEDALICFCCGSFKQGKFSKITNFWGVGTHNFLGAMSTWAPSGTATDRTYLTSKMHLMCQQ